MLKDNLLMLRGINGFSQEEIAEKINISRQAYAKWEAGTTVPDIEKCQILASIYGITIDELVNSNCMKESKNTFFAPKGKNIWGSVIINDRGQVVIPKGARDIFDLKGGTRLIALSDEDGIALVPAEKFESNIKMIMEMASADSN